MNDSPQATSDAESPSFAGHLDASMQGLRSALTELVTSMGDDPRLPQEVSRRYDINKNLSWKVCKIINSTDSFDSVQHVPGRGGMKIFCNAFASAGASAPRVAEVQRAFDAYTKMIELHVGDRANLELYVGSRRPDGIHGDQLEDKRRMSYQGNSAIWGVQARLGMTLQIAAPNAQDPEFVDFASVGGLLGFRRLRSTVSWPVLQQQFLTDDFEIEDDERLPIDPQHAGDGPPLVHDFCSKPLPETRTIRIGDLTSHELCEGPVGMTAAVDVTFGTVSRRVVPVRGDSPESVGEHYFRIDTPMEAVQFDLLIHRELSFELPPRFLTYSRLHGEPQFPLSQHPRFHLPGSPQVQDLGTAEAGIATPHIANYSRLVEQACGALGHEADVFRAFRVLVTYPPMPTVLVLYHPLAPAAGSA